jgi:hypothetical protein
MKWLPLLLVALLAAGRPCRADIVIGTPPAAAFNIQIFAPTGQSFTADRSAIKSIGMSVSVCNCPPLMQFQLTLLNGSGTSGATVATRTATAPIGLFGFLDFDFTGVTLTVGQKYTAVITLLSPLPPSSAGISINGVSPSSYSGGTAFLSGLPTPNLVLSLRVIDEPLSASALQYSAKFLCGQTDEEEAEHGKGMAAYGMYFTVVNLHNPSEKEIVAKMKVATTKADGQSGEVSPFHPIQLDGDQALAVDCSEIRALAKAPPGFLDGFLVIESDFSLDVVAVYTGSRKGLLETFGIERISERKMNSDDAATPRTLGTTTRPSK